MFASRIVGGRGEIDATAALAPPIDLVHLARQTDGDSLLEAELLGLFDRQSAKLIAELIPRDASARARADIAHKLRGSALAIGAGRVATAAGAVERALAAGGTEPRAEIAELGEAVKEARAEIAALRN
jgi:HPt (histidine-containing phosphotransfer) domain-containing protein